ncbi:MAG: M20/M25/M40 family metallo-hydrolase [bacterium]
MKRILFLIYLLLSYTACVNAVPKAAIRSISAATMRSHVEFLASPELEGRDAPGRGSEIAQRYVATRFAEYGLQTFKDIPRFYQLIPLTICKPDYDNTILAIHRNTEIQQFTPNQDFYTFPKAGSDNKVCGPVLLCGYGIQAPAYNYDDFAGCDPQGKFLFVFEGEPQEQDSTSVFNGTKPTRYSSVAVKTNTAFQLGAVGLFIMQKPESDPAAWRKKIAQFQQKAEEPIVQLTEDIGASTVNTLPVFYLEENVVRSLLGREFDVIAYQEGIDYAGAGNPLPLDQVTVSFSLRFKDVLETQTANIVGYYPGKSEAAVVVLAHHDHIGIQMQENQICPGADDNASGTAGLLQIAQCFSAWGEKLQRSVVFLSTSIEEDGTLGAKYFLNHSPIPVDKIVGAVNLDQIGRDGSSLFRALYDTALPTESDLLMAFYSGQTPEIAEIAQRANRSTNLNLVAEPVLKFHSASDHVQFHNQGIPSLFLFSGFHSDYHSPQDIPAKINYEKLVRVVEFTLGLVYEIATRDAPLIFDTRIEEVKTSGRQYGY